MDRSHGQSRGGAIKLDSRSSRSCNGHTVGIPLDQSPSSHPAAIIEEERKKLDAIRTPERRAAQEAAKEKRQCNETARFFEAVRTAYPYCPPSEAEEIALHATVVGSGRVGRSRIVEDPVKLAVRAHIRHFHTPYEYLLNGEECARKEARWRVADEVNEIEQYWNDGRTLPSSFEEVDAA